MGMWFVLFIISAKRIINVLLLAMSFWWPWIVDGCMSCFLFPEMEFQEYLHTLRKRFFACVCGCGCAALHFCRHFRSSLRFPFAAVAYWKIECGLLSAFLSPFLSPFPCFWQLSLTPLPFHLSVVSVYSPTSFNLPPPLFCFISLPWIGGGSCFFHAQAFVLPVTPMPCRHLFSLLLSHPLSPPLCCTISLHFHCVALCYFDCDSLLSLPSLLFLSICHLPFPLSLRSFGFITPVIQSHLLRRTFRFIYA